MSIGIGYVIEFPGHGAYAPSGRVDMSASEIAEHNRAVELAELEAMEQTGRAVLYLRKSAPGAYSVGTWTGGRQWRVYHWSSGRHNIGRTRLDVWFNGPGGIWHGVQIGDNEIVRCRRNGGAT